MFEIVDKKLVIRNNVLELTDEFNLEAKYETLDANGHEIKANRIFLISRSRVTGLYHARAVKIRYVPIYDVIFVDADGITWFVKEFRETLYPTERFDSEFGHGYIYKTVDEINKALQLLQTKFQKS